MKKIYIVLTFLVLLTATATFFTQVGYRVDQRINFTFLQEGSADLDMNSRVCPAVMPDPDAGFPFKTNNYDGCGMGTSKVAQLLNVLFYMIFAISLTYVILKKLLR